MSKSHQSAAVLAFPQETLAGRRFRALTIKRLTEHGRDRAYTDSQLDAATDAALLKFGGDVEAASREVEPLGEHLAAWLDSRVIRVSGGFDGEQTRRVMAFHRKEAVALINRLTVKTHGEKVAMAAIALGKREAVQ